MCVNRLYTVETERPCVLAQSRDGDEDGDWMERVLVLVHFTLINHLTDVCSHTRTIRIDEHDTPEPVRGSGYAPPGGHGDLHHATSRVW